MVDSLGNQERILVWVAWKYEISVVSKLLSEGYVLTTDLLETLYVVGYSSKQILDCIKSCKYYEQAEDIYSWLSGYLGQEQTEDFLISKFGYNPDLYQYFSLESLEKHECWDELVRRKADGILFRHGLYERMSPDGLYKHKLFEKYFKCNTLINPNDQDVLDYLAEAGLWDIVHKNFKSFENHHNKTMLNFLVKHKQFEMIYCEYPRFLTTFPEGIEYLSQNKKYYILADTKHYDKIDWDDYLHTGTLCPVAHAEEAKQWDALMRNHKHLVLLKHFKLWKFVKSFF